MPQTHRDNKGLLHSFRCLARFHPLGVKPSTCHSYPQRGEQVHLVREDLFFFFFSFFKSYAFV